MPSLHPCSHLDIDTSASPSFIASTFASILGSESEQLEFLLMVESPIRGKAILNRGCCGCVIEVADCHLPFSFVLLDMSGFDVILGMDWLSFYCAIINCYRRRVIVCILGGDCFSFQGDRTDRLLPPLYDPRGRGELSFLLVAFIDDGSNIVRGAFPRVVYDYIDVFIKDLIELSPHREVEFSIGLVLGTTPIFMSPNRFAPAELLVLKE
ncbi:uncharacterized protein LOC114266349 [Camellia sinensis]|uniref:uncharacterized protein LOC114266349 n=1 Tax=Camellia sinensis TaxID=4442 RepID=UPI001035E51F|nr:uncharacterized protein LOC114266349 [Camellia sinensis]